jgi:V8-like Glu-specific endopeptidase
MLKRRARVLMVVAIAALAVPMTALALGVSLKRKHARRPGRAPSIPTAQASSGAAQVGALYQNASTTTHDCTASVVSSTRGDLLITAAHCVAGNGKGMMFVPDQHGAQSPYGRWTVTGAYLASAWVSRQDPDGDIAFLTVAPQMIGGKLTEIQQLTGAYRLGATARRGEVVTVTGYPAGSDGDPITCRAKVRVRDGFPTFDCHGYVGGTSGSPWVLAGRKGGSIVGIIGGLHQGGCREYVSYSAPLSSALGTFERAASMTAPNTAPALRGDGC